MIRFAKQRLALAALAAAGVLLSGVSCGLAGGGRASAEERARIQGEVANRPPAPMDMLPTTRDLIWSPVKGTGVQRAQFFRFGLPNGEVWVYLPPQARSGPVPCVVIAPAGTRLFHGIGLGSGDEPEHLPYVRAGYAVVAYAISANLMDKNFEDGDLVAKQATKFMEVDAGIADARAALNYAYTLPWIDKKRIFVTGHSSAATLALQVAAFENKRLAGCIAFAPAVDVTGKIGYAGNMVEKLGAKGLRAKLDALSPHNNVARLTLPLFLFCAEDDSVVRERDVRAFAESVKKGNPAVTYASVPAGEHYDAMIKDGIPAAIAWSKDKRRP